MGEHSCVTLPGPPRPQEEGSAHAAGDFAYVPQVWWCQNLSIRDNIVFGQPWDESRYRKVGGRAGGHLESLACRSRPAGAAGRLPAKCRAGPHPGHRMLGALRLRQSVT